MKALRRMFVFLFILGAVQRVDAQENLMAMLRSDIRAEAQQIMTFAMQLSNDEATNFWPIYREYELERARWGDRRIALIRTFAEQFEMLSDDVAEPRADLCRRIRRCEISMLCKEAVRAPIQHSIGLYGPRHVARVPPQDPVRQRQAMHARQQPQPRPLWEPLVVVRKPGQVRMSAQQVQEQRAHSGVETRRVTAADRQQPVLA